MNKQKYPFTEAEVKTAYNTSVIELARQYGYELETQSSVFHVKGQGGLYIWSNGLGWYCHSSNEKGNSVDFLMKYCGITTKKDAIRLLLQYSHITPASEIISASVKKAEKKEFKLPLKNKETYSHVFAYLIKKRCIASQIVKHMVNEKKIYEDFHRNCVFVAYNKNGEPKYAAVRGTSDKQYRGEVFGSIKDFPWTMQGKSDVVYVFEAPIDAMSHATMTYLNGDDWKRDHRISLGGTSDRALRTFLENNENVKTIVFCLDNDYEHINKLTGKIENIGQLAVMKHAKEYAQLGYKVMRLLPTMPYKDFNAQLCGYFEAQQPQQQSASASTGINETEQNPEPEM